MKIAVIGSGYVGLVTSLGLADNNFKVTNIEIEKKKILAIKSHKLHINEPGLKKLLNRNIDKNYFITNDYKYSVSSDCVFIAVNTPHKKNGIDLSFLFKACKKIVYLIRKYKIKKRITIVIKSTVVPGTLEDKIKPLFADFKNIFIVNNPEFLREGSAVEDFIKPDRIIFGCKDKYSKKILSRIYKNFQGKKIFVTPTEAELCKYFSNIFLSNLISFSNEFSDLCEMYYKEVNYNNILNSFMYDRRFGIKKGNNIFFPEIYKYLIPGPGFGGSCFPKDTKSLYSLAKNKKLNLKILGSIIKLNDTRLRNKTSNLKNKFKRFCIIGVGFKERTSDLRESKSIELMNILKTNTNKIYYIDQNVSLKNKKFIKINFNQLEDIGIDAIIIMNHSYKTLNFNWKKFLKNKNCCLYDFRAKLLPSEKIKVIGSNFAH